MNPTSRIAPVQLRRIALLVAFGFGNASTYLLAKTVGDSVFLGQFGFSSLPELYMLSAGVMALASTIYAQQVILWGLRSTIIFTLLFFSAVSALLGWLITGHHDWMIAVACVYLLAQIRGVLGTIQFSTVLNEQFGQDEPERVVGIVGLGATVAGIGTSAFITLCIDWLALETLLYLAAVIDLLTLYTMWSLAKKKPAGADEDDVPPPGSPLSKNRSLYQTSMDSPTRFRDIYKLKYVVLVSTVIVMSIATVTFVEFQWKVAASQTFAQDEKALAKYFGFFYGIVYLLTGMVQVTATSRILQKLGMLCGLTLFPAVLLGTILVGAFYAPNQLLLWAMTLAKGTDVLRRSVFDPAIQVIYSPLPRRLRRQAIAYIAGVAKPTAEAVAGLLLVLLARFFVPQQLTPFICVAILFWLAVSIPVWKRFRRMRGF